MIKISLQRISNNFTVILFRGIGSSITYYFCVFFVFFSRRESCNEGEGDPPLYVNVNMFSGEIMNTWIDSLQAFFPGLQVRIIVEAVSRT